jgi:predicted enzyme related to lactoylglutathione lyase
MQSPMPEDTVNVRYMVHDVDAAVDFYTKHFGFTVGRTRRRPSPTCSVATCTCC